MPLSASSPATSSLGADTRRDNALILTAYLACEGFRTVTAVDGEVALVRERGVT